ncbi:hypothetical protein BN7_2781 [Wickerhamomyces ciferrii]|uniref:Uncharacterized protein n=1 Tax=Wickerhamomyces ciferrii (strain ATCC 14091 / BCRC 22168 / CBS 111 / JCM 3599 / NBRC 0793 / NRRL Y-1031 F-60-10) TaxID=1206466 RepID=K0KPC3_WICCF|nr:uncharacterized protein BN7_2781 [Wickerhamomyces ciferrii]CCH43234.1 hypothetical protein BN7_2781 [Wickerhamomyces ciferrii]
MSEHSNSIEIVLNENQRLRAEDKSSCNIQRYLSVKFPKLPNAPLKDFKTMPFVVQNKMSLGDIYILNETNQSYKVVSKDQDQYGNRAFFHFYFDQYKGIKIIDHGSISLECEHDEIPGAEEIESDVTTPFSELTRETTLDTEVVDTPLSSNTSQGTATNEISRVLASKSIYNPRYTSIKPFAIYYTNQELNMGGYEKTMYDCIEGSSKSEKLEKIFIGSSVYTSPPTRDDPRPVAFYIFILIILIIIADGRKSL